MYSIGITLFELFTNQILPTPYHVFQLTQRRLQCGHVLSRLYEPTIFNSNGRQIELPLGSIFFYLALSF
jgi:hypothetical protein